MPDLQPNAQALLSGPTLILRPLWALEFGGVAEGLVFSQLTFRATTSGLEHDGMPAFRSSYTRLQRDFPFFTRRWIIEIMQRLNRIGAIEIVHTKRVNLIAFNGNYEVKVTPTPQMEATMLVFPGLAYKVGLLEAIFLQQIHLRHHVYDGHYWVIRSLSDWQSDSFMFLGMATVQRVFARLRTRGLIFVRRYCGDTGSINSYRVNYVQVAEVLGLPPPIFQMPQGQEGQKWIDPYYPVQVIAKPPTNHVLSNVH